jgi:hypothetical protein
VASKDNTEIKKKQQEINRLKNLNKQIIQKKNQRTQQTKSKSMSNDIDDGFLGFFGSILKFG